MQLYYKGKSAGKVQLLIRGLGGSGPNNYGTQPNIIPNVVPGMQANQWGQNAGWGGQGMQNAQWGNNMIAPVNPPPQVNPYGMGNQVNPNYMPQQPQQPQQMQQMQQPQQMQPQQQWGNLGTNNGWGNFNPSPNFNQGTNTNSNNLYPSLDNPTNDNTFNPLNVMGNILGQQVSNTPQTGMNQNGQMGQMGNMGQMGGMGGMGGMGQMGQMQNNVPLQYQMINGMGILNKNPYGNSYGNPYQ